MATGWKWIPTHHPHIPHSSDSTVLITCGRVDRPHRLVLSGKTSNRLRDSISVRFWNGQSQSMVTEV